MVDPYGIVFDSGTGQPLNGASVTIINNATGCRPQFMATTGSALSRQRLPAGGSASDSSGRVYIFPSGEYRFPFLLPGSYQFKIMPPPGYTFPSTVNKATIQTLPGAPFTIDDNGSYGGGAIGYSGVFVINPGPSAHIDIPLDPAPSALWLQKSAGKNLAGQGDFIPYLLTVSNNRQVSCRGWR